MERFPQLQSGFLGHPRQPLAKFNVNRNPFTDYVLDQDHLKAALPYFYSEDVTRLYRDLRAKPALVRDLDFLRRAIRIAKASFGAPNGVTVAQWFSTQTQSPSLTAQHERFLEETLKFVLLNEPRRVPMDLWYVYLSYHPSPIMDQKREWLNVFQCRVVESDNFARADDFITMWLSRPNGLQDMVQSLWTVFGIRDAIQDMSEKSMG